MKNDDPSPSWWKLVNMFRSDADYKQIMHQIELDPISLSDLECMANGAFSPLDSIMNQKDYLSVLYHMRLASGLPWSLPITLPVSEQKAKELTKNKRS